jgi:hypothetical protein
MNDEPALTEVLVQTAAGEYGLQTELAVAMRGVGRRICVRPEIVRALAAAEQLKDGYVITTPEQAVEIADLAAQVIDGEKLLAEQVRDALRIPKQMEVALKGAVEATRARLEKARQTANGARVAWQAELRRQAARLEEKRRQEAQEAARRAAEQAAETGDDAPPPVEVATVEVPRTVSGGTGKMGTQIRLEVVEVVDQAAVPAQWMYLDKSVARARFLAAVAEREIAKPVPGESVVWKGVRFSSVEMAVNRRAQ